jgi:VacB/RNase II family 3'-5' exoribonuclease
MHLPVQPGNLPAAAERLMRENGFAVGLPSAAAQQLAGLDLTTKALATGKDVRDLRSLLWSSIDNDTSRDLDQLEVAEDTPSGATKVLIAIADVDALVAEDSPIDQFAADQTTTVYMGVRNFPMLPEPLSTGATSLLQDADRLAIVVEFLVTPEGHVESSTTYRALVRNKAQLTYDSVGAWLDGVAPPPLKVRESSALQDQLKLQNRAASALRNDRHRHGALNIETIESRPILHNQEVVSLETEQKNSATTLIEDFMIAANEAVARLLEDQRCSFIQRVVRTPARWDRIVALADSLGARLPATPDSKALNEFLVARSVQDPDHFPDLSLAVIKLMGPGEYVLTRPDDDRRAGHFGLAVDDYTHSTAPNRRFADMVTQRLVKAVLAGGQAPYSDDRLSAIAAKCTEKANLARKVEREMSKRIAAVAMQHRIGEPFTAIVTGVTTHGTFVRTVDPHVEGLLVDGQGLDVGDKLTVTLVRTDVDRGFIDFARQRPL